MGAFIWTTRGAAADAMSRAAAAAEALREAEATCRADAGALWGVSLCGPVLLVDPQTREVWTNQEAKTEQLERHGEFFTGKLPNEINIANTAADWAGLKWTMIMLPLPEEKTRRVTLLAHEMWHRIQDELGFPASAAANHHLDTRDGRYLLQLEWRALATALNANDEARQNHIADAAVFRARRHQLFANAAAEEREMELHEGLAEYTGVKLSGASDLARHVASQNLKTAPASKTFVRSFAYANGPAYSVLLDEIAPEWRKTLRKGHDLAALLFTRAGVTLPADIAAAAEERAREYGGAEVAAAEDQRENTQRETIAAYRARFVDGAVLAIPLHKMNMQFDPGNIVGLEGRGTVYPNIRIVDVWGVLTVQSGGALMSADFTRVTVPAPEKPTGAAIAGDGWTLELSAGWKISPGARSGDFVLEKIP